MIRRNPLTVRLLACVALASALQLLSYGAHAQANCNTLSFTQEEVSAALSSTINEFEHPEYDEYFDWFQAAGAELGCSFSPLPPMLRDGFESQPVPSRSLTDPCVGEYSPDTVYCGPNCSNSNPLLLALYPLSDQLNQTCYEHDQCYRDTCISRECNFASTNFEASTCDVPIVNLCSSVGFLITAKTAERFICAAVGLLRAIPFRPGCDQANCDPNQNSVCLIGGSGECVSGDTPGFGIFCHKVVIHSGGGCSQGSGVLFGASAESFSHITRRWPPPPVCPDEAGLVYIHSQQGPFPGNLAGCSGGCVSCYAQPNVVDQ